MCPFSARLINGEGGLFQSARLVCHCLVVETSGGLVLVDTGFGTEDLRAAGERLGRWFVATVRPGLDPGSAAVRQIEQLGFRPSDVRHIVVTHLDLDHAGGLADFPDASVHVYAPEHAAALARGSANERMRYRPVQWSHGPRWRLHAPGGERWLGFEGVRAVEGTGDDVLLVPLHGHTRGHCGVAIRIPGGWLLHCGDAYFFHGEVEAAPRCPAGLAAYQRLVAIDNLTRLENQRRLRELAQRPGGAVRLFCAHDPVELDREQRAAAA